VAVLVRPCGEANGQPKERDLTENSPESVKLHRKVSFSSANNHRKKNKKLVDHAISNMRWRKVHAEYLNEANPYNKNME
jgi:hypothetical protein